MKIEEIVEKIGENVHGQLTYTWNTRQTLEQLAEIQETEEIDLEEFLEYVQDNVFEIIAENEGREAIRKDIYILNDSGQLIE
jgi:DNA-directed RNA polymerase